MTPLKNPFVVSLLSLCVSVLIEIVPIGTFRKMVSHFYQQMTFIVSNMIGSLKAPWVFKDKKVDWISVIGTMSATVSISITTMHKVVKITICADKAVFDCIDELGDAIVQELKS